MLIKEGEMNPKYKRLTVLLIASLISATVMAEQNRGRQCSSQEKADILSWLSNQ